MPPASTVVPTSRPPRYHGGTPQHSRAPLPPASKSELRAERLFFTMLERHVSDGAIAFAVDGDRRTCGVPAPDSQTPVVRVLHRRFFNRVLSEGNLGLGEGYMDGDWVMEAGRIQDVLGVLLRNRLDYKVRGDLSTAWRVVKLQIANRVRGKQWSHVQSHYDVGDDLFESFLDRDTMMYSCGYARTPHDTPEELQANKLDRICTKLELKPDEHLLDIGCGFGGLLLYAARHFGIRGTGITTSARHCELGNQRIAAAGLAHRVRLELRDHRSITGTFDKVVSVGMMEHLPRKEYSRYFERIAAVLAPHGLGLVHCVGCNAANNAHDPFIQRYIFPGSGQVKLSEMTSNCEQHSLVIRDVENLIRHYTLTGQGWMDRFMANRASLDPVSYDDRFMRMWEYYLACVIAAGDYSDAALYQVLFQRDYAAPMPLHRV